MWMRSLIVLALALPAAAEEPARRPVVVTEAALKLHAESLVIDGHNDLPWELRRKDAGASFREIDLLRPQKNLHTDIPRLRKGGIGAQFWSAYVPADTGKKGTALKTTLEQIDAIHRMVKRYKNMRQENFQDFLRLCAARVRIEREAERLRHSFA